MTIVVPNAGEVVFMSYAVGKTASTEGVTYKLGATNITPAETDTAGTYTEAAGGGYASKNLTGSSWAVTGGAPTSATYAQQTWTFTGALTTNPTIYFYYVVGTSTGTLLWAEAFTSFTPATSGDAILLTPAITGE